MGLGYIIIVKRTKIARPGLGFGFSCIMITRPNTIAGTGLGFGFGLGYITIARPNTITRTGSGFRLF